MELSLKLNSSFGAGAVAGCALAFAAAHHLGLTAERAAFFALCPAGWARALGFGPAAPGGAKAASGTCPLSGAMGSEAQCPGARMAAAAAAAPAAAAAGKAKAAPASAPAGKPSVGEGTFASALSPDEEGADQNDNFWFTEFQTEHFKHELVLRKILFDGQSKFQRVQVVETAQFGRTLVMDGCTQSAERDEHIYHESMVHPAMLLHPTGAKSVFIGGGGEFATAREVLRHRSVSRVVMVDIDQLACDICREQLPEWGNGAYDDPRFQVFYEDANKWLAESDEKFDVILMDICDPIEAGPGYKLYTREFYEGLKHKLNPGGIFVTQSGPGAVYNAQSECFTVIHNTLAQAFQVVLPYAADVPSFGSDWGFNLAYFSVKDALAERKRLQDISVEDFDKLVEQRVSGGGKALKFLDGVSWRGLTGLPKEMRQQCKDETRVMTVDNPVFMFH